jgi:hypothetical protein
VIVAHLRRFNQNHQWDVRQVLPIGGFFMSATHLHHSDKKFISFGQDVLGDKLRQKD